MLAIIDYGVGNLFSLSSALDYLGVLHTVTDQPDEIDQADRIILPGVGAFGDAMTHLSERDLIRVLVNQVVRGKPLLGICLGMQMLFERSFEFGEHVGLCFLTGSVVPLRESIPDHFKVPHIGWNRLKFIRQDDPFLQFTQEGDYVYYVHSYYVRDCADSMTAGSDYGTFIPGVVHKDNLFGTQFHPEKSGTVGLRILQAFCSFPI
ncbi:imidazole glycerol phosphate synthase subunit HisH [Flexilinea flocculi]|jgi:glutamine amidotransferase|uniref:Imidazole glycerol phosphate synthase subunit HisH n=1 Tax=Flexilinea flocculi TaxID=1678840 RepID=A0A0S7BVJ5_9CHLR|nr:imidazole glycerol phosphate synthase subunit HisH [Flexilinea flocculi]NMB92641.1 imidazole glycerol phosphate synthase subunit HisH [Flexilinea flocculi]GAP40399.1 imidazole glycerol phosphate synthase, glutamine amidotransferase subunit [Flexilinea flocculi]